MKPTLLMVFVLVVPMAWAAEDQEPKAVDLSTFCSPPPELKNNFGRYTSPLKFENGRRVATAADWADRRNEILKTWHKIMGPWPELLANPKFEYLNQTNRENFVQHRVRVEAAPGQMLAGYLLIPNAKAAVPAVIIPFYEAETSISKAPLDFGYQLTRRGFVTLSIGSPGGDARKPEKGVAQCQPLSFLGYVVANCHTALCRVKEVDPARIGILGHSYGGKWAMFASCLYEKFACAVWCDPGIVFDESRPNVNYWEPWYLGLDPAIKRKPGVPTVENPRTGAYLELIARGRDLHELHALMAPRPFLVSGGSEDPPERWKALNNTVAINNLLGFSNRVAMTNRKTHTPTSESNEQIYAFLEKHLNASAK